MDPALLLEQRTQLFAPVEIVPHILLCPTAPRSWEALQCADEQSLEQGRLPVSSGAPSAALVHLLQDSSSIASNVSATKSASSVGDSLSMAVGSLQDPKLLPQQLPMSLAAHDPLIRRGTAGQPMSRAHRIDTASSSTGFGFADAASTVAASPRARLGRELNNPPRCPQPLLRGPAFYAQVALAANNAFLQRWKAATGGAPPTVNVLRRVVDNSLGMAQLAATEAHTAAAVARAVSASLRIVSCAQPGSGSGINVHPVSTHGAVAAAGARSSMYANCAAGVTEATNERDRRARSVDIDIQFAALQCCLGIEGVSQGNAAALRSFLGVPPGQAAPSLEACCLRVARRLRRAMRLHYPGNSSQGSRPISHTLGGALSAFSMALHSVYASYGCVRPATQASAAPYWKRVSKAVMDACQEHKSTPSPANRRGTVRVASSLEAPPPRAVPAAQHMHKAAGEAGAENTRTTALQSTVPPPAVACMGRSVLSSSHMRSKGPPQVRPRVPTLSGDEHLVPSAEETELVPPELRDVYSRFTSAARSAQWPPAVCVPVHMPSSSFAQQLPLATHAKVASTARRHAAEDVRAFLQYLVGAVLRRFGTLHCIVHSDSILQLDAHLSSAPLAVLAGQQSTATPARAQIKDTHASFVSPARRGWLLQRPAAAPCEVPAPSTPPLLHMQAQTLTSPPSPLRKIVPLRPHFEGARPALTSSHVTPERRQGGGTHGTQPSRDASWGSMDSPLLTGRGQGETPAPLLAASPKTGPMLSSVLDVAGLGRQSPRHGRNLAVAPSSSPLVLSRTPKQNSSGTAQHHQTLSMRASLELPAQAPLAQFATRDDLSDCSVESDGTTPQETGRKQTRKLVSLCDASSMLRRTIEVEVWRCVSAHAYETLYALEAAVERHNDQRFNAAMRSVQKHSAELLVPADRHHDAKTVWMCPPAAACMPAHIQADNLESTVLAYLPALRALYAFTQHRSGIGKAQCAAVVLRSASACAAAVATRAQARRLQAAGGLSADELLPLLVWLLAVAGCENLPSQVAFTEEWLPPSHSIGDWGYAAAMLSAAARGVFSGALRFETGSNA